MNDPNKTEEPSNVLPFIRPSTSEGGSGSGNWLKDMSSGTRFLASRRSMGDSKLCDFVVCSDPKSMPAVVIGEDINSPHGGFRFVDPKKFIRDYEFFCTLEVLEPKDGNNQVQPSAVDGDAKPAKQPKVHARKQRIPSGREPGEV